MVINAHQQRRTPKGVNDLGVGAGKGDDAHGVGYPGANHEFGSGGGMHAFPGLLHFGQYSDRPFLDISGATMVQTLSTMMPLGRPAPDFSLPEPATGKTVSLSDYDDAPGLLVVFLSNHCPYVKHIAGELARFGREYQQKGLAMVGIMANDVANHPDDAPPKMAEEVKSRGYTFPYLYDESQVVAKAYQAACTPDFFLFNGKRQLVYRGQFDDARPSLDVPVSGTDLRAACDAVLADKHPSERQTPSVGCNIKWKAGNNPPWFG
jgi:peroxiredoxin